VLPGERRITRWLIKAWDHRLSVAERFELLPLRAALKGEPAAHFRVQMMAHGSEASYKRSHLQYSDSPQPDERLSERLTLFGGQVSIPVRNKTYHSVKASFVLIAEHTDRPLVVCFS
jgi:hypothetical protein